MSTHLKTRREKTIQDAFLSKIAEGPRLRELQGMMAISTNGRAISGTSGISDMAVIDELMKLGIGNKTLTVICLIPLLEIARAKGRIDTKERSAVLCAAEKVGLTREGAAYQLLEWGLDERRRTNKGSFAKSRKPSWVPVESQKITTRVLSRRS